MYGACMRKDERVDGGGDTAGKNSLFALDLEVGLRSLRKSRALHEILCVVNFTLLRGIPVDSYCNS